MSKTRLVLLVLLAVAMKLVYDAGELPVVAEGGEVDVDHASVVHVQSVTARFHRGLGVYGSHLARPSVRSMVQETHADMAELESAIAAAPAPRARQARELSARIAELDSIALARLDEAKPIAALKIAMQSSGLSDTLRRSLIEERLLK